MRGGKVLCVCIVFPHKIANEVIEDLCLRPEDVYLGQGTLRPDLIESASSLASGKADAIKTHHNDTDLVRELRKQVSTWGSVVNKNHVCDALQKTGQWSNINIVWELKTNFLLFIPS